VTAGRREPERRSEVRGRRQRQLSPPVSSPAVDKGSGRFRPPDGRRRGRDRSLDAAATGSRTDMGPTNTGPRACFLRTPFSRRLRSASLDGGTDRHLRHEHGAQPVVTNLSLTDHAGYPLSVNMGALRERLQPGHRAARHGAPESSLSVPNYGRLRRFTAAYRSAAWRCSGLTMVRKSRARPRRRVEINGDLRSTSITRTRRSPDTRSRTGDGVRAPDLHLKTRRRRGRLAQTEVLSRGSTSPSSRTSA